jgi:hypothetical protein
MRLRRIDILRGTSEQRVADAKDAAAGHTPDELLPELRYTERNYRWSLLYEHAQGGQVDPRDLRRLPRDDLAFLAGMTEPAPDLSDAGRIKLLGNVARAVQEVQRRSTKTAAVVGAVAATLLTLLIRG